MCRYRGMLMTRNMFRFTSVLSPAATPFSYSTPACPPDICSSLSRSSSSSCATVFVLAEDGFFPTELGVVSDLAVLCTVGDCWVVDDVWRWGVGKGFVKGLERGLSAPSLVCSRVRESFFIMLYNFYAPKKYFELDIMS